MNKLVSVIVPNYNYGKYLSDCIISIINNKYRPIELIIVDDASTDNSLEEIRRLNFIYDETMLLISLYPNRGVSYARNSGIIVSKGEYITCFDADDIMTPNSIESRVKYLEKYPKVSMVWGNAKKINMERGNAEWNYAKCLNNFDKLETYSRRMNNGTLMWRREVFEKYGLYYEGLRSKEDKEWNYRLGIHPDSPFKPKIIAKKIDDFIMIYRRHLNSKHKQRMKDKKWCDETDKLFDKRMRHLQKEGITKENTRLL